MDIPTYTTRANEPQKTPNPFDAYYRYAESLDAYLQQIDYETVSHFVDLGALKDRFYLLKTALLQSSQQADNVHKAAAQLITFLDEVPESGERKLLNGVLRHREESEKCLGAYSPALLTEQVRARYEAAILPREGVDPGPLVEHLTWEHLEHLASGSTTPSR